MIRLHAGGHIILLTLLGSLASAQQEPPAEPPSSQKNREMPMMQGTANEDGMSGRSSPKMEHMADAMSSMAKTCDTMMKREMQMFPVKMAALGILGTIGAIGLILLVALEVQWIRLLGLRIRQAKRELGTAP